MGGKAQRQEIDDSQVKCDQYNKHFFTSVKPDLKSAQQERPTGGPARESSCTRPGSRSGTFSEKYSDSKVCLSLCQSRLL